MDSLNYNFILFFSENDYNKIIYSDFENLSCVRIQHGFKTKNRYLNILHYIHNSEKINRRINLPFKQIWFKNYFNQEKLDNSKPFCFIFLFIWVNRKFIKEYIGYLKKKFPNAKFVCYYTDIISTLDNKPDETSSFFDLSISYDKNDARLYKMEYFPTSFSDIHLNKLDGVPFCDVLFLGRAKSRFKKIESAYKQLTSSGLKCLFFVTGVTIEEQIDHIGIIYLQSPMHYMEYLKHVVNCRFILEIEQPGAIGETLRTWEAIHFDKALLTDNIAIKDSIFFDSRYISIIQDGGINYDFIKNYEPIINPYKDKLRPIRLLEFIQDKLNTNTL